jgi:hypothetical protein
MNKLPYIIVGFTDREQYFTVLRGLGDQGHTFSRDGSKFTSWDLYGRDLCLCVHYGSLSFTSTAYLADASAYAKTPWVTAAGWLRDNGIRELGLLAL